MNWKSGINLTFFKTKSKNTNQETVLTKYKKN